MCNVAVAIERSGHPRYVYTAGEKTVGASDSFMCIPESRRRETNKDESVRATIAHAFGVGVTCSYVSGAYVFVAQRTDSCVCPIREQFEREFGIAIRSGIQTMTSPLACGCGVCAK